MSDRTAINNEPNDYDIVRGADADYAVCGCCDELDGVVCDYCDEPDGDAPPDDVHGADTFDGVYCRDASELYDVQHYQIQHE